MENFVTAIDRLLPRKKIDIFGKDSWLKTSLPYYLLPALILRFIIGSMADESFGMIAIIYAALPILDEIFSLDERNPNKEETKELLRNDWYFRMALYVSIVLSWILFIKTMTVISAMEVNSDTIFKFIGVVFISMNFYAAQFSVAHELLHRYDPVLRFIGTVHMVKLYYMHFTYHHNNCHHPKVGIPEEDPSTAPKGETVYQYIVRSVWTSLVGVYKMEQKRGTPLWKNAAVVSVSCTILFASAVYFIFGAKAAIIHSLMALGSICYLESTGYIEHYGLVRKKLPNGQYEPISVMHSWNAPHRFTNYLFFKLQRHSDHHEDDTKPYQTLLSLKHSPFLPHGYTLMFLMSYFPSVRVPPFRSGSE